METETKSTPPSSTVREFVDALTKPKTKSDLFRIATDPEFKKRMRWALLLTKGQAAEGSGLEPAGGKEHGFVGYVTRTFARSINYSRVYRGEEKCIDLFGQFSQNQIPDGTQCLIAHTHPSQPSQPFRVYPSSGDLNISKNYGRVTKGFVSAIGGNTFLGMRVLLLSALDRDSTDLLDPDGLYSKLATSSFSDDLTKDYKTAGLCSLLVNLETGTEVTTGTDPETAFILAINHFKNKEVNQ